MSFRARLAVAFLAVALLPLAILGFGVRRETTERLERQYRERVAALVDVIEHDLAREGDLVATRLDALAEAAAADNRFRLALRAGPSGDRAYLLDYAGTAMRLAGLSMLQVHDESGRILSSGHFRNEYDRLEPALPRELARASNATLVEARAPDGPFLALAQARPLDVAGRRLRVVGGTAVNDAFLTRLVPDPSFEVVLEYPGGRLALGASGGDSLAGTVAAAAIALPMLDIPAPDSAVRGTATLRVAHSSAQLVALRRSVDAWFTAVLAVTGVVVGWSAFFIATRLSRPIVALARRTAELDLDRLDVDFSTDRTDEIGRLSQLLGAMTERLRASVSRLREIERRAAVGELARQVNHDVKNGLVPIRNVMRHLTQVAEREPARLGAVFEERRGTLEAGLAYLETLAATYARLSPGVARIPCDVNAMVGEVSRGATRPEGVALDVALATGVPPILADPVALRRILENLVANAIESLEERPGRVTVSTAVLRSDGDGARVGVTISDTGRGMSRAELGHAFDDFYTTKRGGTGLGLSIVRRLVRDLDGSLKVETEPGRGTRVVVELPILEATARGGETGAGSDA